MEKDRIDLTEGQRRGAVVQFQGIRYARADRFAPPRRLTLAEGLADRQVPAPYALQNKAALEQLIFGVDYGQVDQAEDCLYLTVTVPLAQGDLPEKMPVMVWFHGGGFSNGGIANRAYDPSLLAEEGQVIVVAANYRLGAFGFLFDEEGGPGHPGFLDQLAALVWVNRYIDRFGGDPEAVCIFGQSAGGTSVHRLLAAAGTSGLFQRAIIQSAPFGTLDQRERMEGQLAAALRPFAFRPRGEDLREAQGQAQRSVKEWRHAKYMHFAPRPGVNPLPAGGDLDKAYAEAAKRVDLLIGANSREPSIYLAKYSWFPKLVQAPVLGPALEVVLRYMSRAIFQKGTRAFARQYAAAGGRVYHYTCSWGEDSSVFGGCHCAEMPLVFGAAAYRGSPLLMNKPAREIDQVGRRIRRLWTDFAKSGRVPNLTIPRCIRVKRV
ncbi:carboxylesterase family protein [Peptococcus simiae]|uniref:carboxylesterase family protein n=1 Tax=Peptococcus simiae TaxID=1643805 RepID=UPI00397EAAB3